jgi:hypothetical protein
VYFSPSIMRMIKSMRMKWAVHVAFMGRWGMRRVLGAKPVGKRPLGWRRPRILDGVIWIRLIWLRIGASGGDLWAFWSHKMLGSSSVASQEGIISSKLVTWLVS